MRSRPPGILLALLLATPAAAPAAVNGTLRFGGSWVDPTGELAGHGVSRFSIGVLTLVDVDNAYTVEGDDSVAPFAGFELRLTDLLGLELSLERVSTDLDVSLTRDVVHTHNDTGEELARFRQTGGFSGELDAYPLTLALNVHLLRRPRFDLYLAPVVGYVLYGDAQFDTRSDLGEIGTENDFAWGAAAGVDLPVGKGRWVLTSSLRYLRTETRPDRIPGVFAGKFFDLPDFDPGPLELDPVVVRFGVGRRFGPG